MADLFAYYIVLPLGIATVAIAFFVALFVVVRLWTVSDEDGR
jgi:hypothetical protein